MSRPQTALEEMVERQRLVIFAAMTHAADQMQHLTPAKIESVKRHADNEFGLYAYTARVRAREDFERYCVRRLARERETRQRKRK